MSKDEKLQIFLQYLHSHGYQTAFAQLQADTNITADSSIVSNVANLIQTHQFNQLELLLDAYLDKHKKQQCMLIVLRNHYVDLLSQHRINEAVEFLRGQLQYYCKDEEEKHQLAGLIIGNDFHVQSYVDIIKQILLLCYTEIGVLEPNRLTNLIQQAQTNKILECKQHSQLNDNYQIFQRHFCTQQIRRKIVRETNYISLIEFSDDNSLQVQVSSKVNLIIYFQKLNSNGVTNLSRLASIKTQHQEEILSISISPCNNLIGSTSKDKTVIISEYRTNRHFKLLGHTDSVKDMVWHKIHHNKNGNTSNSQHSQSEINLDLYQIFTISCDGWLFEWDKGILTNSIKTEEKVLKMSYKQDRDQLIIVSEFKISIYQLTRKQLIKQLSFNESIITVKIERNHKYLIIARKNGHYRIAYYSLPNLTYLKQFFDNGLKSEITTLDIGWFNSQLIVCGTNDGESIIWHIQKGHQPIKKLQIHKETVQLVKINPLSNNIYYYIDMDILINQILRSIPLYQRQINASFNQQIQIQPPQLNSGVLLQEESSDEEL